MKTILLLLFAGSTQLFAQAPTISGDTMLCPNSTGTAVVNGSQVYDSYTWYTKFWFSSDEFEPVNGENGASFTYDWYTYDQSLIKVVVTLNGETFESNTIQLDSYAWVGMTVGHEMGDNVTFNPDTETFVLCEGTSFPNQVFNPYSANIQWFLNDSPISGANDMTYQITEAGTYYVTAAPPFCPNETSTSMPITVTINSNCNLAVNNPEISMEVLVYPNPANDFVKIASNVAIEKISIYSLTGQLLREQQSDAVEIFIGDLPQGIYIIDLQSEENSKKVKFIKQ